MISTRLLFSMSKMSTRSSPFKSLFWNSLIICFNKSSTWYAFDTVIHAALSKSIFTLL
uniref:Uncharacterized protein n=1 Tax=Arundo donax TaxID=35708 RepID=A0A0A8ZXY7_ARUDO